jgi:hypothetical protein
VNPDGSVVFKTGSNSSQFVQFLMADRGYKYDEALALSLDLAKKGKVVLTH